MIYALEKKAGFSRAAINPQITFRCTENVEDFLATDIDSVHIVHIN